MSAPQFETAYFALLDSIDEGFCVIELLWDEAGQAVDYRYLQANAAFEKQTGLGNCVGRTLREHIPNGEGWPEVYGKVARTGQAARFTHYSPALDRWFDANAFPIGEPRGSIVGILFRDVTRSKQEQIRSEFLAGLTRSLATAMTEDQVIDTTTRALGTHLNVGRCYFVECLEDENFLVASRNWVRDDLGSLEGRYSLFDFGGMEWWRQYAGGAFAVEDVETDPLTRDKARNYLAISIRSYAVQPFRREGPWTVVLAVTENKPRRWTAAELALMDDVAARVWPLVERARAEQRERQLAQQAVAATAKFRAVFDQSPVFAAITTLDGIVIEANRLCLEMCGYTAVEVIGKVFPATPWWRFSAEVQDRIAEGCRLAAKGQPYQAVLPYHLADGSARLIDLGIHPVRDDEGTVFLLHPAGIDITERQRSEVQLRESESRYRTITEEQKLAQEALRQAHGLLAERAQQLESLVQQRTAKLQETIGELEAFSYSIAHDMRAPLRSLQGFSETLLNEYSGKLDEDGQFFLRRISLAAVRMDRLILDVLNYSRIVRADLQLEVIDLEPLIQGILDTYPMFGPDRADIVLAGKFPLVRGNEAMLTQIFSNLLGNAVKFVAAGKKPAICISAKSRDGKVRIAVRDNGLGIPPEELSKIFGMFHQVGAGHGGTGIGLAIVKKAADRMGGSVGVESAVDDGSTFWIEIQGA